MKVKQISVFLENKKGRLYDVSALLAKESINIRALNIAETDDFGVLRMVVDRPVEALSALKNGGFVANTTDIVAVEIDDTPGGLSKVLKVLSDADINVEYMYGFIEKRSNNAIMVFRFESPEKAISVISGTGIKVINETEVKDL
ncbi:MAG: amino acid-binding protein [Fibrobacteres bacterium]|nr:amino acid-binding protein [Fibrobacterota bacterium]